MVVCVSTHSHAEAAAYLNGSGQRKRIVSTHSHAEAAAALPLPHSLLIVFQHTATRRRLRSLLAGSTVHSRVSTHSHAEAAAAGE